MLKPGDKVRRTQSRIVRAHCPPKEDPWWDDKAEQWERVLEIRGEDVRVRPWRARDDDMAGYVPAAQLKLLERPEVVILENTLSEEPPFPHDFRVGDRVRVLYKHSLEAHWDNRPLFWKRVVDVREGEVCLEGWEEQLRFPGRNRRHWEKAQLVKLLERAPPHPA